ncbi:MAG: trigger factor, partial [Tissierellia bacterium]|nr:trigger factor [Tissierellia bacterium]
AYDGAIEDLELEPVDAPDVNVEQLEKGKPIIVELEVTVKPEVELGDYKGIEIEKLEYNVTEEDVEKELESVQRANGRIIDIGDRESQDGDILTIDFEGYIDGEQFEGGTAENQDLEIGTNQFIPGFEEQLVGKAKGDEVDVNVTFPEDYFQEDLRGKEALFKVTIHEIKERELPVLDDEFAKDVSEFDTLEEYRESIRKRLEEEAEDREQVELRNRAIEKMVEISKIDLPEVMVDNQIDNEINEFNYTLQMQGMDMEQYFSITNTTMEDFMEQARPAADKKVRAELILSKIGEVEEIEVTDEDIDAELEKMAKQYNQEDVEEFKSNMRKGDLEHIRSGIMKNKAVDLLLENIKFI